VRRLARETHLVPSQLVLPMFVREGLSEPQPIGSMPGVVQHSLDSLRRAVTDAAASGIGGVMLFGVPEVRDARGSVAHGVLDKGYRQIRGPIGGRRGLQVVVEAHTVISSG
jgi:porphobilinogen synthase